MTSAVKKMNSPQSWKPPPQQDPAILSYQRSPSSNLLPSTNGNRETGFVEKLLHSYGFIQCCEREARLFFHFSEYSGDINTVKIGDAVEFQLSSDRRTGRPIACAVVKVDETSYEVISDDRFTGTVVQEARVSKSKNGCVNGNIDGMGRVTYEHNGECFFLPFGLDDVADSSLNLKPGDKVSFFMATDKRNGNIQARKIELVAPTPPPRCQGVVCSMKDSFGFIERADVVKEIFFHYSEYNDDINDLVLGDDVEFDVQTRNNKEVAVNIKKLPVGTVIFEDISIDKINGKIIKTLKSNRRQSDPLGGRISCQTAKGTAEYPYGDKDQSGEFTLQIGDLVEFQVATDRRDKLQRATKIQLCPETFSQNSEKREKGVVSNLKDGYGFIQCTDRESKIFFHFSELVDSKKEIRTQEEVEFTVVPDPSTPNRPMAIRIRSLPRGSISFVNVRPEKYIGTVDKEPSSHKSPSKIKDNEPAGNIVFDYEGKIQNIPYYHKDIADMRDAPKYGDKVEFSIGEVKRSNSRFAAAVRVVIRNIQGKCHGFIATLKDNYGFIENADHDKEVFFHFSSFDGDVNDLDLGDEVEYTVTRKSAKLSAENIRKVPKGTVAPEDILYDKGVLQGKVIRPMRIVNPDQDEYSGLVQVGGDDDQDAEVYPYGITSLTDKRDFPEILNSAGALDYVIKTMEKYTDILYVQRKGLVLIQMLCEPSILNTFDLCSRLIKVITQTMENYQSHVGLLKEACVAVHLLSELGHDLCDEFVKVNCHQLMFNILADHIDQEHQKDLLDLAGECLVIFGLNETVKGNMLLAECKRGNLAGVICLLEMDANVNFVNSTGETPLAWAVEIGNEFIVRRLLSKGVNDLKDALAKSLQQKNDRITGLLLGALCHKRSHFHVPWGGLGLGTSDFNTVWLEVALPRSLTADWSPSTRSSTSSVFDGSWKHITSQVKESEEKRRKRKENIYHHSISDSSIGANRHKFRYSFKQSYEDLPGIINSGAQESPRRRSSPNDAPRGRDLPYRRKLLSPIGSPASSITVTDESLKPVFLLSETDENEENSWMFESSQTEVQEWKQMSLTGANLPYSQNDPRVTPTPQSRPFSLQGTSTSGPWSRKMRSPSPSLTNLDLTIEDVFLPAKRRSHTMYQSSDGESSDIGYYPSADDLDNTAGSDESRRESESYDADLFVSLDLSSNGIQSLHHLSDTKNHHLRFFSSVEKLALTDNLITTIPDKFFESMENLHVVDLRRNKLTQFPVEVLLCCPNLTSLDLTHNEMTHWDLDSHIVHSKLTELTLNHNSLSAIPSQIGRALPRLEVLQMNSNNLENLNSSLGLVHLRRLELNHNNLTEIPEDFLTACTKLDVFEAAFNKIEKLPTESAAQHLPRLARLKLRNNNITGNDLLSLPKFILDLPTLKFIDLCSNKLTGLPSPPSWKSTMLKEVLVSRNQINKINLEGGKSWSKLESLHLSNNGLTELPGDIGLLSSLTSLDVSHNPLTTLPDELGKCHKMWEFPLSGLNLDLDPALLKGKVKDLIIYLHHRLKRATEYYRMKLMVIGYGGRGKTTLLKALMKKYKTSTTNQATVGVIVQDWKYERRRENKGTVTYTLSTWDFAGQEEFYSTHQCYMSNRALYLVVCNIKGGTSEIDRLKPWLCNIQARAPGCPVVVVMTHLDKVPDDKQVELVTAMTDRLNQIISKGGYPEVRHCVPVICTRENALIEQLRETIKKVVDEYKVRGQYVMGQKVPASYVKLADLLAEAKKTESFFPVIKHNQLLKMVQEAGLDLDEDELHQAVRFLHECGVLLHYPDKALNLRDLYFIDPGWLCRMMAQIVTVHQINPFIKNGILRKKDVNLLFTGKKLENFVFPKDLIPQYLRLLEKFEIALPHSEQELLVPCHLPERKPILNMPVLSRNEKICRYYEMTYVPLGMWSRLITRLIVFSKSQVTEVLVGQHEPTLTYWNKGIYMFWSPETFCLVDCEGISENKEEIAITVPISGQGSMILGLVVDHIDGLIEEWYPGLTTIDPMQGQDLMMKYVPCFMCTDDNPFLFKVEDLLQISETSVDAKCDQCNNLVPLAQLVPDIMMSDLPSSLLIGRLDIQESADNLLGDGGFGNVYQMNYMGQDAAVKIFSAIGDIHPHKMLRQEVTILRSLRHPSVVSLLGVSIQPRAIVLELAPLGSMATILKRKSPLDRMARHRIALQVTEGLSYLHKILIVYRDMKPDNVLIYSLSLSEIVNAKISDYGISRFSTPDGLMAQEGTPAYRAPEVIRGETYSFKADVFSLGITLYALVTGGRHPFDDYDFKSEMDRVVAEGHLPPPITHKGCAPWPDMQKILASCMHQSPDRRPTSSQVWEQLKNPEILGLKRIIPISKGTTVECFTIQEQEGGRLYLWVASGDCDYVQLSRLDLKDSKPEVKGAMFRYGRILALLPISQGFLLVGTQMCKVWLYDTVRQEFLHCTSLLPDAVLCMLNVSIPRKDNLIFVGLANGTLAVFPQSDLLYEPNATPMYLSPGKKHEAVRCLEAHPRTRRVYSSCGSKIVVLSVRKGIALEKILETRKEGPRSVPIYGLCVSNKSQVFVCHKGQPVIQVWDIAKETLKAQIDVSSLVGLKSTQCRLTALYLQENHGIAAMNHGILWAGTGDGRIVLIDSKSGTTIASTHRYCGPIRALKSSACKKNKHSRGNFCGVLSGGFGYYNSQEHFDKKDRDDDLGCVLLWDQHFARIAKELQTDIQRRAAFVRAFQEGKLSKSLEPVHLNQGLRHGESEESLQNFEQSTQEVEVEVEGPENPQCQNEAEQSLQENEMFDSL